MKIFSVPYHDTLTMRINTRITASYYLTESIAAELKNRAGPLVKTWFGNSSSRQYFRPVSKGAAFDLDQADQTKSNSPGGGRNYRHADRSATQITIPFSRRMAMRFSSFRT